MVDLSKLPTMAAVAASRVGRPNPKPESRKRIKGRKKRGLRRIVKAVRPMVIERADGCCARCGHWVGEDGHTHHRVPRSLGGRWELSNLELLCADCHERAHRTHTL